MSHALAFTGAPLTAGDVARIIDRSAATVKRAADLGHLPVAGRTPRGVRIFRREDVDEYLRRREQHHG